MATLSSFTASTSPASTDFIVGYATAASGGERRWTHQNLFKLDNTAAAQGIQIYNTADQTTNYERGEFLFSSTRFTIRTVAAGSGSQRDIDIRTSNTLLRINGPTGNLGGSFGPIGSVTSTGNWFAITGGSYTQTSGSNAILAIVPTYNQASGTAANTDLLINRTQTAIGSGAQYLIDAQVASASQFSVTNAGNVTLAGAIIGGVQALSGAGAVNVTQLHTDYTSTGGAQALTLANGTAGQLKTICHVTDGGSGVLTPTTKTGFTTITFTNAGDSVTLRYSATGGWYIVGIFGAVAA